MAEQHDHSPVEAPRVSRQEAGERLLAGKAVVVDVRSPEEYQLSHVPGAINLPLREMEQRLGMLPREQAIITYCT